MIDISKQENDELFKILLDKYYFKDFKDLKDKKMPTNVELIVFPECNQKCEYCYVNRHRDELYPKDIRDRDIIFNNIKILLSYFQKNDFLIDALDIFSGSFLDIPDGFKVLDILLEYSRKKLVFKSITMPTNGSFLYDDAETENVEKYLKAFKDIGIRMHLSYSVDGKIIEDKSRPINNTIDRDDMFYNRLMNMVKKYGHGIHPMVSAYAIEDWIENYKWFMDLYKEHDIDNNRIMLLEVRNDDWTYEAIGKFLEFLNYEVDYRYQLTNNIDEFALEVFGFGQQHQYDNIGIRLHKDGMSCSIQGELFIRTGDLAIVPCHRLSYDKFLYGKFIVEDNEIVGIESNHLEFSTSVLSINPAYSHPKCENCNINKVCPRGCLGSQYEVNKDPFVTIDSVCDLYMAKTMFLVKKYDEMGLFDHIFEKYSGDIEKRHMLNELWKLRQIQRGEAQ